ncbi:energy transducer TonB [Niveispirillum sp. KHB5.9]|uniref:energy transducer TonB n=1 Tax=Niveispirillum sp. KHB5.9 TaxID=3400269 RepID=UPI003A8743EF
MRVPAIATCLLLFTAQPAMAMTWQEANKASVALMNEGKLKQAFDLAWQAAELYEQSPTYKAASHERLLLNALDIFLQTEEVRETPATVRKAIMALKRHVPDEDPTLIALSEQLALSYDRVGDFQAAQDARDRVISLYARNHGEDSVGHLLALINQARQLKQVQDITVTRKYLDRATAVIAGLPPNNATRLMVEYEHALLTLEDERKDEARALFQSIAERGETVRDNPAVGNILRPTYGMLAYIAFKRGDEAALDRMVEATRGLPLPAGETAPLFREAPDMPGGDRLALSGSATVEYKVSTADGRVSEIRILDRSGNPQYAELAVKAVGKWRYQPTAPVGSPGQLVTFNQSFRYQYENDKPELGSRLKRRN